ncbi:MAG: hypothetical protein ACTSU2_13980 [Promethearchaeota archaeon]
MNTKKIFLGVFFIIFLLIFVVLFIGGIYLVIEEEKYRVAGGIAALISIPFFIVVQKFVLKLDRHAILDVMAGTLGSIFFLVILILFIYIPSIYQAFLTNMILSWGVLIGALLGLIGAYKLADKESFRLGGMLLAFSSIFMFYALIGIVLGGF